MTWSANTSYAGGIVLPAVSAHEGKRFPEDAIVCMAERLLAYGSSGRWVENDGASKPPPFAHSHQCLTFSQRPIKDDARSPPMAQPHERQEHNPDLEPEPTSNNELVL